MTDRMKLLEAVAEALRHERKGRPDPMCSVTEYAALRATTDAALSALDALPAQPQPQGETVEVRAHIRLSNDGGAYIISGMGALNGGWIEPRPSAAFATITARVPLLVVPTIPATVTEPQP